MSASITSETTAQHRDSRFGCNICLESVVEPVVTLCGHLYCWPCLFRWLEPGMTADEFLTLWGQYRPAAVDRSRRTCPVCKASCNVSTVVPIYVRGMEGDRHSNQKAMAALPSTQIGEETKNEGIISSPSDSSPGVRRRLRFQAVPSRPLLVSPSQQQPPVHIAPSPPPLSTGLALSLQQALFGTAIPPLHRRHHSVEQQQQQLAHQDPSTEFLSRVLLMLGSFVILCLLLF
jgi:E3 ubiquitin-protein ligase RNF5